MDKQRLFLLFFLFQLTFSLVVFAEEPEIQDVKCGEMPDSVYNMSEETLHKLGKSCAAYQIYNTFEISGNLMHKTIRKTFYNPPPSEICLEMIAGEKTRYFDVTLYQNEVKIAFEPYLDVYEKRAKFPCFTAKSNDTVTIDYFASGEITPVSERVLSLHVTRSEWLYPFDKYEMTSWRGLEKLSYTLINKLILPYSFVPVENKNSCQFAIKFEQTGIFLNETKRSIMASGSIIKKWQSIESHNGEVITEENKRIIIWPTAISGPIDYMKDYSIETHNLSANEWDNIFDERTGCYLNVKYERTEIIKYFFIIATILILSSTIYFLFLDKIKTDNERHRISKIFQASFLIWSFQEGISSLTPIVRPTSITLFDSTILFPLAIILPLYAKNIFLKTKTSIINWLKNFEVCHINKERFEYATLLSLSSLIGAFTSRYIDKIMPLPFPLNLILLIITMFVVLIISYQSLKYLTD